jgi:hypothetical protein
VIIVLASSAPAWAWGPATHIKLAHDLLAQLNLLPAAAAAILARYGRDYIFGNIAADVVLAKRLSKVKQICHHWETGLAIFEDAQSDAGRAFALGYMSHLAADTVAHNKFIPRQLTVTRSSRTFGHLYWELRADSTIGPHYWNELKHLLNEVFDEHQAVLSTRLTETLLPFELNWRLFYRMNRFVGRRTLRKAMDRWYTVSRWRLSDQLMREYRAECLHRMLDVVAKGRRSEIMHHDPNGNAALSYTKAQRRQLRQMAKCGTIAPHIMYEAAAGHAPSSTKWPPDQHTGNS